MSRSLSTVLQSLVAKLPPGFALGFRGGVLDGLLEAIAGPIVDVERSAAELFDEIDPRSSSRLIADFERLLGPDPCARDQAFQPLSERRRVAHQRWTATGGQSLPYLIALALKLGVVVAIDEFWPTRAGNLRAGQRLRPEGIQFVWRVRLAPIGSWNFRAGDGRAGQPLGIIILSGVECELRRIAHAHTTPVFSYTLEEAS